MLRCHYRSRVFQKPQVVSVPFLGLETRTSAAQTGPVVTPPAPAPLLSIEGLRTVFGTAAAPVAAVDGVTLSVARGRTLGIVGESGCGKSVLSLSVMRLVPNPGRTVAGRVKFDGQDLLTLPVPAMRAIRGARIAMIFQEPMTSLNPGVHRRRPDHRGDARARPHRLHRRAARACRGGAGPGAHPGTGPALRRISPPDVGRHAPARDDRDGAGLRTRAADRRRADHRARRDGAGRKSSTCCAPCSRRPAWRSS